ncbi:MAG: hypothetical protein U0169_09320 [Polyangiaceae bacterium]
MHDPRSTTPPGRPFRISMLVALASGLVLVALPLYVLRKPRLSSAKADPMVTAPVASVPATAPVDPLRTTDTVPPTAPNGMPVAATEPPKVAPASVPVVARAIPTPVAVAPAAVAAPAPPPPAPRTPVALGTWRSIGCHDPGPRRTRPEDCDHLGPIEDAIAQAIVATGDCMPDSVGGGTVDYVVDFSFGRKREAFRLATKRGEGAVKDARAVAGCKAAIKHALADVPLPPVTHAHARYAMAITAAYPAPPGVAPKARAVAQATFGGSAIGLGSPGEGAAPSATQPTLPATLAADGKPCGGGREAPLTSSAKAKTFAADSALVNGALQNGVGTPKTSAFAPH